MNVPQITKLSRASQLSLVAVVILLGAVFVTVNSSLQEQNQASHASGSANMLLNPSFESGGGPWWLNISSYGGAGKYTVTSSQHEDGSYAAQVNITSAISNSSNWWYVQLLQNNLPLQSGQTYTVTFWAKASSSRSINSGVQNGVSPYQIFTEVSPVVTTSWRQFTYTLTPNATLSNTQLVFNLGSATGTVWIDNVSLSQSNAAAQPTIVPPTVQPTIHPTLSAPTPTFTPTPTVTPTPYFAPTPTLVSISTPSSVPTPTLTAVSPTIPSPTNTPIPGDTYLVLKVGLQGIGTAGDSQTDTLSDCTVDQPPAACDGNMKPNRMARTVSIDILDASNQEVLNPEGTVTYDTNSGKFTGTVDLGPNFPTGLYTVKVKTDQFLRSIVPGIQTITSGQTMKLPYVSLVAGDIYADNQINIVDYNILLSCYSDLLPASASCTPTNKILADLTDDGAVNQDDLNLFLRELSNVGGQ